MKIFKNHLLTLVFNRIVTPQCHLCHDSLDEDQDIKGSRLWCKSCFIQLQNNQQILCPQCGLPSSYAQKPCGQCLKMPPPWDNLYCLSDYQEPLKSYIHQFKHQGQFWLAHNFAALLAPKINHPAPMLIPVPLHWHRLVTRGFNQSDYLAQAMAQYWSEYHHQSVNVSNQLVIRKKPTMSQKDLNLKQRQINTKGAFNLNQSLHYQHCPHVALVDDVVTTGSTLTPLCQLLRQQGVQKIDVYCLARTQLHSSHST